MVQGLGALHPALKGAHSHLHGARREGAPNFRWPSVGPVTGPHWQGPWEPLVPCVSRFGGQPPPGISAPHLPRLPCQQRRKKGTPHLPGQQCPSGPWLPRTSRINCFFRFQRVSGNTQSEVLDCISRGFSCALKGAGAKPQTEIGLSTKLGRRQPRQTQF